MSAKFASPSTRAAPRRLALSADVTKQSASERSLEEPM
eukprot:CAMPEP_0197647672 /NCGR_PEP_ID=MMETSP1338-20131121/26109_1 /TAXON_ID=43686 ORGANISM="Pelagodinium beii, Strain RCC1491" /NCGR_SAMPLE_ID=MMETSP1338 /ASSEMBLY_ACC=CAM_ASM_000754 /LENGTH=37 /DNA_ID= /DNA_START= /DNA_END= /DNA_ORIENTATION=